MRMVNCNSTYSQKLRKEVWKIWNEQTSYYNGDRAGFCTTLRIALAGVATQATEEFSKTKEELADAINQMKYSGGVTWEKNSELEARLQELIAKTERDIERLLVSRQAMAKLMAKKPYNISNSSNSSYSS